MAMTKEVDHILEEHLLKFSRLLDASPTGWYYIPRTALVEFNSQDVRFLTWLLMDLCKLFPQYIWTESENFQPPGVLISWRKRY